MSAKELFDVREYSLRERVLAFGSGGIICIAVALLFGWEKTDGHIVMLLTGVWLVLMPFTSRKGK